MFSFSWTHKRAKRARKKHTKKVRGAPLFFPVSIRLSTSCVEGVESGKEEGGKVEGEMGKCRGTLNWRGEGGEKQSFDFIEVESVGSIRAGGELIKG
mmetsp:Transcript_53777/g.105176  ORF Transcript_53777/g.105176 Transcript_53777/m.105176 type:complete len:97 (-) Transcript_53777:1018-1308(-)